MQFLNPWAFLVLGFIPLLILIHRLKPRPQVLPSTTLFLWQEVVKERHSGFYLQKFRNNLPLFLQCLVVLLAAAGLAEPLWVQAVPVGGNMIVVLDTSASMQAASPESTRFEQAHRHALELIESLSEESQLMLIEASNRPSIRSPFSDDPNLLKARLDKIQPLDVVGDLKKAIYLALSFLKTDQDDWIFLITDGGDPELEALLQLHPRIKPIFVGGGVKNIGITKFEFRQELGTPGQFEVMLEVKNFTDTPILTPIKLWVDNRSVIEETIGLDANESKMFFIPYAKRAPRLAQAFLGIQDDFSLDNEAYLILKNAKSVNAHLFSEGNFFLEKLLESFPNFRVTTSPQITQDLWEQATLQSEIVILDRMDPQFTLSGNYLMIDSFSPNIPISRKTTIANPKVIDWNKQDSIMEHLDFRGVQIKKASRVEAGPRVNVLMESNETGLVHTFQKEGLRSVFLGFDLHQSDLPLKVTFPVLMNNIFQWLYPQQLEFSTLQTKTGQSFPITVLPHASHIKIQTPSGRKLEYPVTDASFSFVETSEVGIYKILEGSKIRFFAVNLLDAKESEIRPLPSLVEGLNRRESEVLLASTKEWPLWVFLFVIGGLSLILEWHTWLNREEEH